jgi:hypothetical protein
VFIIVREQEVCANRMTFRKMLQSLSGYGANSRLEQERAAKSLSDMISNAGSAAQEAIGP